jgi:hypothetical protein
VRNLVLTYTVKNSFAPIVLNGISRVKVNVIPEIRYCPARFVYVNFNHISSIVESKIGLSYASLYSSF